MFRFRDITKETKIFAAAGHPFKIFDTVRFFNTTLKMEKTNAVFIPIPSDSVESLLHLAEEIGIEGISVDVPHKEEILKYVNRKSKEVVSIGAGNVIKTSPQGWMGYNTDAPAFSDSLLEFLGIKDFWFRKLTIVGAGDIARAVAAEVYRLKGKALIINRNAAQARLLAEPYRFSWADPESQSIDLMRKYFSTIIITCAFGTDADSDEDLLEFYKFSGKETVMDLSGQPDGNRCRRRAEEAGCRILDGYDMFHRQARYQYSYFMNKEFPPSLVSRVGYFGAQ